MSTMDKIENVKQQYSNDKNLSVRTKLHLKHSTNKQGFVTWLFDKYEFSENCRILELGCGNGGMRPFLHNALKHFNPHGDTKAFTQEFSFNLQNGYEILSGYFSGVKRMDFEDSLSITETQDLVDWIKSTISIASYSEKDLDGLFDYFEDIRKEYGAINIEKECGLFISIK
ncbi:hypothetical protein [Clostridium algidicarnis]|uniref:hypothetical protein n=1 Tax=Clostridium algidicarnis TaxID=37659 RepID=UPI003FD7EA58